MMKELTRALSLTALLTLAAPDAAHTLTSTKAGSDTFVLVAPSGARTARIVIHHPEGNAAALARARAMQTRLAARGNLEVELRSVSAPVAMDNFRVFYDADRQTALSTRGLLGNEPATVRDFSHYRPLPRPGTIELWLATPSVATDRGAVDGRSNRPTPSPAEQPAARRADPQMLRLLLLQE